jgi:hypothetical protein
MPNPAIILRGQRELIRAFTLAGKETSREIRSELRGVAEPIRADAEQLAAETIPRIGPKWSRMRVGVTTRLVYVAPRQRGVRNFDDPRARPKFADLVMGRAMEPALERNRVRAEAAVEEALARIGRDWESA